MRCSRLFKRALLQLAVCCNLVLIPTAVFADVGIPLISCVHPGLWLLLPAVILLEGIVALIVLRRGVWQALKIAAVTNAVSTLVGVPIKWLLVRALTPLSDHAGQHMVRGTECSLFEKFAYNVVAVPFGISYSPERWRIEVMIFWLFLIIPFFLLSVLVEWYVARRLLKKEDRKLSIRWALYANVASYTLIVVLFWHLFGLTWWWLDR